MTVEKITSTEQFNQVLSQNKYVVVDFFATWCGPCKKVAPTFLEFAAKYVGVKFVSVDIDDLEDIAEEYDIASLPTFKTFVDSKVSATIVGANTAKVETAIKQLTE